jgi:precorrin-8X/cobalt-precorrin-8 methylmutase
MNNCQKLERKSQMKPYEIEQRSFAIIDAEAGPHGFSPAQWTIVRRMIHTSADFDYLTSVRFHPRSVEAGIAAIRSGTKIFTDTNMVHTGIRKKDLARYSGEAHCLMASAQVAQTAAQTGTTRAVAAVDAVADQLTGAIYAVGNAPTALLRLIELISGDRARPALVIGLPVGFVNAAESKAALCELDIPYITNVGRKGGSNVAASVVNALILLAAEEQ